MPRGRVKFPRIPRVCESCGTTFYVLESRLAHATCRFCSAKCQTDGYAVPLEARFNSKLGQIQTNGCIPWMGSKNRSGYGEINLGKGRKGSKFAHRLAYELRHGPIDPGLFVCHKCDNPECVNPDHLFLGTSRDNTMDMMAKGRGQHGNTHCCAKLVESQVLEIRSRYIPRKVTYKALAAEYGVSATVIQYIIERRTWKHI